MATRLEKRIARQTAKARKNVQNILRQATNRFRFQQGSNLQGQAQLDLAEQRMGQDLNDAMTALQAQLKIAKNHAEHARNRVGRARSKPISQGGSAEQIAERQRGRRRDVALLQELASEAQQSFKSLSQLISQELRPQITAGIEQARQTFKQRAGLAQAPVASTSQGGQQTMTWQLFKNGQLVGQTTELSVKEQWERDGGTATEVDSSGGGGGDLGIGGDQEIGGTPTGNAQVGDPLDPEVVLALFSSGENSREETVELLRNLGWDATRISRAMESVNQPGTTLEDTAQPTPVTQTDLEQPEDITDLLKNLGVGDITRRFAIESGVSPDFRNIVQGRAQEQLLPFALQTARGFDPSQLGEGEKLSDLFSTQRFQDFLGNQGGFQSRGSSLRGAADFLRDRQGEEGDFSDPQKIIRGSLLNLGKEGSPNVGSQLFSRLIAEAQSRGTRGRTIPGINVGRAVGSSLENVFARDPGRFSRSAPDFIDFLSGRGLI